jgi:purine-cytosine permease-like protein
MDPRVTVAGAKAKVPKVPLWSHKAVLAGAIVVLVAIIGVGVWNFFSPIMAWRLLTFGWSERMRPELKLQRFSG